MLKKLLKMCSYTEAIPEYSDKTNPDLITIFIEFAWNYMIFASGWK